MVGKLSIAAQQQMVFFDEAKTKVDRLHSLIEQMVVAKVGQNELMAPIGRTATDVARVFMNGGYGVMADSANQIAMNAKRGGSLQMKIRSFRELVNSIKAAVDTRIKMIIAEEGRAQDEIKAAAVRKRASEAMQKNEGPPKGP